MDTLWLPEGDHWDLHIQKHSIASDLSLTGGGWKLVWHTTESPWNWFDAGVEWFTGQARGMAPHFLIGGRAGARWPYVAQFVPLNESSMALRNDSSDGYQTNRANCIQVEICGRAAESQDWSDWTYKALANLFELIQHRVDIPNSAPQDFSKAVRMTDPQWVLAKGHVGHSMAPDNDHVDPGRFREGFLIDLVDNIKDGGYSL